ncbi:MAG: MotA/TolQ/ExbB proton channel family protein [Candidatus Aminicenantes bacterium]|nr:MotA/TolQ/ExbB proton channel family protein [Candidatus Aminicenantes bacterium]
MQFGLVEMFQAMSVLAKVVSFLLIALSIVSIYLLIERTLFYRKAKVLSKAVAPKLADLLKAGQIKEALALASKKEYKASHLARVTAAASHEFLEGGSSGLPFEQQIDTAERGTERAASIFNQELKRGLSVLATIATSSPFIGLFGTISGIINAFKGMAATGSGGIGAVASGIAEALVTTAFGIGVAIIALWCYNYLSTKSEIFDAEMSNTSSQVLDFFIRKQAK